MKQSHTPGPWTISPCWDGHYPDAFTISAPLTGTTTNERGLIACTVGSPFVEQQEANARLIAAAPELLSACEVSLKVFQAWVHDVDPRNEMPTGESIERDAAAEMCSLVYAAIAKAKGTK